MNTDMLISGLTGDLRPIDRRNANRFIVLACLAAGAFSLLLVLAWLGVRPDLPQALLGFSFWMKAFYTLCLAALSWRTLEKLRFPEAAPASTPRLLAGPVLLLAATCLVEWWTVPAAAEPAFWLGTSWTVCPLFITALALPILASAIVSLARFAPARPVEAGAVAGLFAGAAGASIYGLHCGEVSPGFVLVWYSLGIGASALVGGVTGARFLRW
jgi:hypothetical protein